MLSELFEELPEEGDMDKPKMVFFFDEAHLLFNDAPKALLSKVTQVVKLIRSKGVGVYFISQSPSDIPDEVLSQLSNRVQHALRAYTPAEQKAVRTAAQTFRPNPAFKTEDVICEMGVGEALVSFLDENGVPGIVERAFILPPQSLMKPADDETVTRLISESIYERLYRETLDRDSAYELLVSKKVADEKAAAEAARAASEQEELEKRIKELEKQKAAAAKQREKEELAAQRAYERQLAKEEAAAQKAKERRQKNFEKQANKLLGSALNTIGRELGKSITRGLFGNWK
jgi:DNA helicase HerA-like ATPase